MVWWRGLAAALAVALNATSLAACTRVVPPPAAASSAAPTASTATGGGQSASQTAGSEPSATDTAAGQTGTETETTDPPSEAATATGVASSDVDPAGPDITLFTVPECSVVPGGALSGADALTMFVAVRNGGPGSWNSLVPYRVVSDIGPSAEGNSALSEGESFTAMQVDLGPGDYSRTHHFTVTADPNNQIRERDESNNQLTITVSLPDRPTGTVEVGCTSP
jgi:CARDB